MEELLKQAYLNSAKLGQSFLKFSAGITLFISFLFSGLSAIAANTAVSKTTTAPVSNLSTDEMERMGDLNANSNPTTNNSSTTNNSVVTKTAASSANSAVVKTNATISKPNATAISNSNASAISKQSATPTSAATPSPLGIRFNFERGSRINPVYDKDGKFQSGNYGQYVLFMSYTFQNKSKLVFNNVYNHDLDNPEESDNWPTEIGYAKFVNFDIGIGNLYPQVSYYLSNSKAAHNANTVGLVSGALRYDMAPGLLGTHFDFSYKVAYWNYFHQSLGDPVKDEARPHAQLKQYFLPTLVFNDKWSLGWQYWQYTSFKYSGDVTGAYISQFELDYNITEHLLAGVCITTGMRDQFNDSGAADVRVYKDDEATYGLVFGGSF